MAIIDDKLTQLFPEVDRKKTAAEVRDFFLNRHRFQKFVMYAGDSLSSLKSPVSDGMPKAVNYSNGVEEHMTRQLTAQSIVQNVMLAINGCDDNSQKILKSCFIRHMTNRDVQLLVHASHSKYAELKVEALNQFADTFDKYDHFYDLHIYKNAETLRKDHGN